MTTMARVSSFEHRRPQRPGGMGRGAMMALLVHGGLFVALAFGVSWRSSEPAGSSAELWAAVPQVAAPAAVEPPPLPKPLPKVEVKPVEAPPPPKPDTRDADIAIEKQKAAEKEKRERDEREKVLKQEREKAAKLERDKAEKEKREATAETERVAKLREENLKRMQGMAGATGGQDSKGTAQREAGPSANYGGKVRARVFPNIVFTDTVPPTPPLVEVRAAPDGTITARRLLKSSGNSAWDEAVLRAIDRTETLPKDDNGRVPSPMVIEFKP